MFNEALNKVVEERDKVIEELRTKETALQADSDKYRGKSTSTRIKKKKKEKNVMVLSRSDPASLS